MIGALLVADAHLDLLLELAHRRHRLGERDVFARTWLPLLEAGGVRLQACPVYVDLDRHPEGTLREALAQVACLHEAVRENAERVCLVRAGSDLDAVEREERLGLVLALEGVEPFGYDLWSAEVFVELGLRLASLTWNRRNPFADGAADEGGLSRLGRALVDRLVELGVVLDLAHASRRTFDDVLARAAGAPVLVSHAGCRAVHDHPRNLDDTQLRALADAGGLLCAMLIPIAVDPARPTIERACEHLEHAVETMGADRVGVGGDFTRRLAHVLPPTPLPPDGLMPPGMGLDAALDGLAGPEDYPALEEALLARGWGAEAVAAVLGGNLLRFLRRALPDGGAA
ncbi:MAG TPA: membrane dipeptidase [Gaiellaceae bacterium]|nr:membrane dipeptidase [Gaiellaceae bacterium]